MQPILKFLAAIKFGKEKCSAGELEQKLTVR